MHTLLSKIASLLLTLAITVTGAAPVAALSVLEQAVPREATQTVKDQATRLAERKQEFAVTLTDDVVDRATNKCENAQVKLGSISTRATDLKRRRESKYSELVDQLGKLDAKLSAQKIPHDNLHNSVEKLDQKWTDLQSSMLDYTTSLDDSRTIDCVADPRGFVASLASARRAQVRVLEQNDDFHQLLRDIKQQLATVKDLVGTELPDISYKEGNEIVRN